MKLKLGWLLELLYPFDIRCSLCKSEHDMGHGLGICGRCEAKLYRHNMVEKLGGMDCYGMLQYQEDARRMIVNLKFNGKRHYARTLGILAADSLMALDWDIDAIVPVPLHPRRKRQRGYNQSELIAKAISRQVGIPVEPGLVQRVKETRPQTDLDGEQRRFNVEGAFYADIKDYKSILLLDDVLTTGSTLTECGKTIILAGAECKGFAIARV